jgi:hypothetical protein
VGHTLGPMRAIITLKSCLWYFFHRPGFMSRYSSPRTRPNPSSSIAFPQGNLP